MNAEMRCDAVCSHVPVLSDNLPQRPVVGGCFGSSVVVTTPGQLEVRVAVQTAGMAELVFPLVESSLAPGFEKYWRVTTVAGTLLVFLLVAINTVGSCCRLLDIVVWTWKICNYVVRGAYRFWRPARVDMVDKMVQSQTTYTWKAAAPRFKPLPEYQRGKIEAGRQ